MPTLLSPSPPSPHCHIAICPWHSRAIALTASAQARAHHLCPPLHPRAVHHLLASLTTAICATGRTPGLPTTSAQHQRAVPRLSPIDASLTGTALQLIVHAVFRRPMHRSVLLALSCASDCETMAGVASGCQGSRPLAAARKVRTRLHTLPSHLPSLALVVLAAFAGLHRMPRHALDRPLLATRVHCRRRSATRSSSLPAAECLTRTGALTMILRSLTNPRAGWARINRLDALSPAVARNGGTHCRGCLVSANSPFAMAPSHWTYYGRRGGCPCGPRL